jgi:hypothetical protein
VSNRAKVIVGAALVCLGLLLAFLPKDWIESRFGFEPDGGNGMVELALILVPIALGVALILQVLARVSHRHGGYDARKGD